MTNRVRRVAELIKQELADILTKDFEFGGAIVTIHEVDMTPDLKQAHVYLGVIGREDLQSEAVHKLRKAAGAISAKLSRRVILKNAPNLHFSLDDSIERGVRVLNIIEEIDEVTPPDEPPYPNAAPSAHHGRSTKPADGLKPQIRNPESETNSNKPQTNPEP